MGHRQWVFSDAGRRQDFVGLKPVGSSGCKVSLRKRAQYLGAEGELQASANSRDGG